MDDTWLINDLYQLNDININVLLVYLINRNSSIKPTREDVSWFESEIIQKNLIENLEQIIIVIMIEQRMKYLNSIIKRQSKFQFIIFSFYLKIRRYLSKNNEETTKWKNKNALCLKKTKYERNTSIKIYTVWGTSKGSNEICCALVDISERDFIKVLH